MLRPIEEVLDEVGTIEAVLSRHGLDSHPRRLLCPNPQHHDKKPGSVRILPETSLGPERIMCYSCGWNENPIGLARLLGETVNFISPDRKFSRHFTWHPIRSRREIQTRTRLRRELGNDPTIEVNLVAAKKLATLGNRQAVQKEILTNWDYFSENFNLPRVYQLVEGIWEYGTKHHGLPAGQWKYWVERSVGGTG